MTLGDSRIVRFASYEVDRRAGELRKQGVKVRLQEKPFQLLLLLLEHQGDIVTRDQVREALWPADTFVDFDHSLGTAVAKLRTALGDSAKNPRFVETVGGRGYRFLAPINPASEDAGQIGDVAVTLPLPEPDQAASEIGLSQPEPIVEPEPVVAMDVRPATVAGGVRVPRVAASVIVGFLAGALALLVVFGLDIGGARASLRR